MLCKILSVLQSLLGNAPSSHDDQAPSDMAAKAPSAAPTNDAATQGPKGSDDPSPLAADTDVSMSPKIGRKSTSAMKIS